MMIMTFNYINYINFLLLMFRCVGLTISQVVCLPNLVKSFLITLKLKNSHGSCTKKKICKCSISTLYLSVIVNLIYF